MEPYLIWLLAGFGLAIVELLSGTFYLLMLGVAAFCGGAVAWLGMSFPVQIVVAAAAAAAGCYAVHVYHARNSTHRMVSVDSGQPAHFERWVDEGAGLARVNYRGASWEARVESDKVGARAVEGAVLLVPGALLYVIATEGSMLRVSRQSPA